MRSATIEREVTSMVAPPAPTMKVAPYTTTFIPMSLRSGGSVPWNHSLCNTYETLSSHDSHMYYHKTIWNHCKSQSFYAYADFTKILTSSYVCLHIICRLTGLPIQTQSQESRPSRGEKYDNVKTRILHSHLETYITSNHSVENLQEESR